MVAILREAFRTRIDLIDSESYLPITTNHQFTPKQLFQLIKLHPNSLASWVGLLAPSILYRKDLLIVRVYWPPLFYQFPAPFITDFVPWLLYFSSCICFLGFLSTWVAFRLFFVFCKEETKFLQPESYSSTCSYRGEPQGPDQRKPRVG
jgi:hypothetical protein